MSVLIKGMKMPQSCYMCDMQELSGAVGCKHAYDARNSEWGRALNCPLIELPDHGDLIDRDAVVARMAEWSKRLIETYGENDEYVNCLSEVLEGLGCDDVVIPAERSEASPCDNCDQRSDIWYSWFKMMERSEE